MDAFCVWLTERLVKPDGLAVRIARKLHSQHIIHPPQLALVHPRGQLPPQIDARRRAHLFGKYLTESFLVGLWFLLGIHFHPSSYIS